MLRPIYLILTIGVFARLGCNNPQHKNPVPFPENGTVLDYGTLTDLVFQWHPLPKTGRTPFYGEKFRLYRFTPNSVQQAAESYRFEMIQELDTNSDSSMTISKTLLAPDQTYAWEVVSEDKQGAHPSVKQLSEFTVMGSSTPSQGHLDSLAIIKGLFYGVPKFTREPDNCRNLICSVQKQFYIHIAFLRSFDIMNGSRSLSVQATDSGTAESNSCLQIDADSVKIDANFVVQVPCDVVAPDKTFPDSKIEAFLYKGQELVKDENRSLKFMLNDAAQVNALTVRQANYLHICEEDSLVCQATVELKLNFKPQYVTPIQLASYTLVFFLPPNQLHVHQDNIVHQHTLAAYDKALGNSGSPLLAYYQGLDNDTTKHISKHVCLVPLPICARLGDTSPR